MKQIPPIDITEIVQFLRKEGPAEITNATFKGSPRVVKVLNEWNKVIKVLDQLAFALKRGGDLSGFVEPAKALAKSAGALSLMASEILSMVPGPIGIVCSVINAVVCFCEGNVVGGILELLGCIPGGKAATKGVAKFAPQMEKMIMRIVENSPELLKIVKQAEKTHKAMGELFDKIVKKYEKSVKELQTAPAGPKFDSDNFFAYGLKNDKQIKNQGLSVGQTMVSGQQKMNKDIFYGTYGNPSNPFSNMW